MYTYLRLIVQFSSGYWNICLRNAQEGGNICFNVNTEHSGRISAQNLSRRLGRKEGSERFKYHCLGSLADLLPNALKKTRIG